MPDQTQREQFATAILDAMRTSVGEYDTPFIDGSSLEWACLDGRVDMLAAVDTLLAAGWRPPARVIRDRAELDALPVGSVVTHFPCPDTAACVWARIDDCWTTNGDDRAYSAEDIAEGHLHYSGADDNLALLHTPENGDAHA